MFYLYLTLVSNTSDWIKAPVDTSWHGGGRWFESKILVIEKLFFATNVKTAIDVAQVRWAILYKLACKNIEIFEYTPLELKSAICWNWKANKLQLQNAIKIFFWLSEIPKPDDAADAIWLAYMWILKNKKD